MRVTHRSMIMGMNGQSFFNTPGKRVRLLRQEAEMNQTELARRMGTHGNAVTPSYISQIEKGDKTPSVDVLVALAKTLDTTSDYLLMLSEDPRRGGTQLDTVQYMSPEADRIAQHIDAMSPDARQFCLSFVQQFADHQARLRNAEHATLMGRVELLLGREQALRIDAALAAELASGTNGGRAILPVQELPDLQHGDNQTEPTKISLLLLCGQRLECRHELSFARIGNGRESGT